MTPAFRRITHAAVLLWWLLAIVLMFVRPALSRVSFSYRAKRTERLLEARDLVEADRVIARLRWEAKRWEGKRYRRRVEERWPHSQPADVDAS